jgi:hypothetical protein
MVSSPAVSARVVALAASRRVYTIVLVLAVALGTAAAALGCRAPAPGAHDRLAVEAEMTKGPATAAVTIVEFSDYQ